MAIPLLANCDIAGKDITADALLTQRALATYISGLTFRTSANAFLLNFRPAGWISADGALRRR